MYFAFGENTSASTGRWVLRNRRWVCASTAGSFTSFGGTRRSSQGDISATSTSVRAVEDQLADDLLGPGGAGLGVGGDDDVVVAEDEVVPDRRVEVVVVQLARLARPDRGGGVHGLGLRRGSVDDRGQVGALGLGIVAAAHQRHRLDDPHALVEAPAEQRRPADRQRESRAAPRSARRRRGSAPCRSASVSATAWLSSQKFGIAM